MDAAEALHTLNEAGITLTLAPAPGTLRATPRASLTDGHRSLIREHKAALLEHLARSAPGATVEPEPEPLPVEPSLPALPHDVETVVNAWLDAIGERHPADRRELLGNCARDPEALAGLLGIIAEAGISAASPSPEPAPEPVTCGGCLHFRADGVGNGSGLGHCRTSAPASRRPPARWPNAPHLCSDHEETAP